MGLSRAAVGCPGGPGGGSPERGAEGPGEGRPARLGVAPRRRAGYPLLPVGVQLQRGQALLLASGSASLAANELALRATPAPNQPGSVCCGPAQALSATAAAVREDSPSAWHRPRPGPACWAASWTSPPRPWRDNWWPDRAGSSRPASGNRRPAGADFYRSTGWELTLWPW